MRVLIVEDRRHLGMIWKQFLERAGADVELAEGSSKAAEILSCKYFDALVINIAMANSAVLAVSDLASYKNPDIAIIAVTSGSFFSDGSIFSIIPNARGCLGDDVNPKDLVDIVSHYAARPKPPAGGVFPNR